MILNKKIRVVVLSQEDHFVIPRNIFLLDSVKNVKVILVVSINSKGSLKNKKINFIKGFGFFQSLKMGFLIFKEKVIDSIDLLSKGMIFDFPRSLKSAAKKCKAKYKIVNSPNSSSFLNELQALNAELVISFSAPCIFNKRLLELPKHGCINLHCSLLPKFAGLLPSFWTIYKKEKLIGATIHYMDDKIDNGKILGQVELPMPDNPTVFKVILLTKRAGGFLMLKVIKDLMRNNLKPINNHVTQNNYFTWPSIKQMRDFRKNGGRLV